MLDVVLKILFTARSIKKLSLWENNLTLFWVSNKKLFLANFYNLSSMETCPCSYVVHTIQSLEVHVELVKKVPCSS